MKCADLLGGECGGEVDHKSEGAERSEGEGVEIVTYGDHRTL